MRPLACTATPTQGRAVLVYEVARPTPETTSAELAELAKAYVQVGGRGGVEV